MKYRITINGKPAREAPEPVELDEMKIAVMDIQLSFAPCTVASAKVDKALHFSIVYSGNWATVTVEEVP